MGIAAGVDAGADYVEIDVRRAADGVPLLLHDPLLARTAWLPLPVRRVPSSVATRLPLRGARGSARVPTLAAALAAVAPTRTGFAVDVKDAGAMPAVVDAARTAELLDRMLLWSQHGAAVADAVRLAPGNEVALLRDTVTAGSTARYLGDTVDAGAHAVSLHQNAATPDIVAEAHGLGLRVYCWAKTVGRIAGVLDAGVDGIVTDWPAEARAAIAGR